MVAASFYVVSLIGNQCRWTPVPAYIPSGGSQPGEAVATILRCPGRAATQRSNTPGQRGSQESRRQDHGKLICPHVGISVRYLQKTYLYFELFPSCHLFSPSVYGKALFKLCKTNLVYNVLEVPGWVLVKQGTALKQRHLFPLFLNCSEPE